MSLSYNQPLAYNTVAVDYLGNIVAEIPGTLIVVFGAVEDVVDQTTDDHSVTVTVAAAA